MTEWTSPYNPFNSMKALVHAENFEGILSRKVKPPIVVNMDLTNLCNYNCGFCMFGGQRERADSNSQSFRQGNAKLPEGYTPTLPKIWKDWGVKAVCLAGGGEPSLHKDCLPFIKKCGEAGLDLGFVTNGYLVNNQEWWNTINDNAKFVGFSIDAGNQDDYSKVKGVPKSRFNTVINNLEQIANQGKVQIGYKFLLDKDNQTSIYEAAKIGRKIGANHFQFRPAIDNYVYSDKELKNIWNQISQAQKDFETDDYKIMGVQHKFNPNLTKKHDFNKCRATMLTTTWCADGNVYMCTDTRGNDWAKLGEHYPNPKEFIKYWGSSDHFDKVSKINFHKNCDRCTLGPINEMFEEVFIKDKMDRNLI